MLIKRKIYLENIRRFYESNLIKVLTGVRRCGKSVLLNQIKEELISEKKIKEDHIISINFEDIKFSNIKNYIKLNDYILKLIVDDEKYYIFLDEIQHVNEFEKTLASLKATQNVSIFVTGSNSKLLSGRLASLLVGRCKEFKIMPFTYSEFVDYYKENGLELPNKPLQNYIRYGGMPQRMDYELEEDIKEYLKSIYYGIVDKDICNAKSKINKDTFLTISKYIINNASKEFSVTSIVDYYNQNNSDTIYCENVYRYLDKLEKACLISRVKRYDIASKRTLKQTEKQFVVDNGFLLDECILNGSTYALPFMRSSEVVYMNSDYIHELGYEIPDVLTWDFIFEVSEAATQKNKDGTYTLNGQNVMIPFIYKSTDNMMIQMLKQKGAGYSDDLGNINIFNDDTKEILQEIAKHASTGAFSTFKISSYPANFLNAGQCVFAIDSTAGSTWMGSNAPLSDIAEENKVDFETVVRMVPQYDTSNPYMISQGPSICIFNKEDSNEVMASWLFAQYLLTNKVQTSYAETEGYVPVTSRARNTNEYQEYLNSEGIDDTDHYSVKIEATKILLENVEHTFTTPVFNGSASLRDASGAMIEDVVKAIRRNKTVDDAFIEEEFENVKSLYRLTELSSTSVSTPLPTTSIVLLSSLVIAWVIIAIIFVSRKIKLRYNKK